MSLIKCDSCGKVINTDSDPQSQYRDGALAICTPCWDSRNDDICDAMADWTIHNTDVLFTHLLGNA